MIGYNRTIYQPDTSLEYEVASCVKKRKRGMFISQGDTLSRDELADAAVARAKREREHESYMASMSDELDSFVKKEKKKRHEKVRSRLIRKSGRASDEIDEWLSEPPVVDTESDNLNMKNTVMFLGLLLEIVTTVS